MQESSLTPEEIQAIHELKEKITLHEPNGRRALRAEIQARYARVPVLDGSPILKGKIAPRAARRTAARLAGKTFRPLYGWIGDTETPFKDIVSELRRGNVVQDPETLMWSKSNG